MARASTPLSDTPADDTGEPGLPNVPSTPGRTEAETGGGCDYPQCPLRGPGGIYCNGHWFGTGCNKTAHLACINRRARPYGELPRRRTWTCLDCQRSSKYKRGLAKRRGGGGKGGPRWKKNLESSEGCNLAGSRTNSVAPRKGGF